MTYTLQQKYNFLCSLLYVHEVDYWEGDALVGMKQDDYYFQFSTDSGAQKPTVDEAVEELMRDYGAVL